MAEHDDAPQGEDELNLETAAPEGEAEHRDSDNPDNQDPPPEGGPAPEEADELEISFGDEGAPRADDTETIRNMRARLEEQRKEIAELRRATPAAAPAVIDPGPKPTLEGCDYDGDKFEQELDAWKDRQRKAGEAQSEAQRAAQAEQERFQSRLQAYGEGKSALKVKDFDVAETAVTSTLSAVQQAVALKAASDPAKLIYALGRHPQKLAELAKLSDPIDFAVAVAKLEGQLKVTSRKAPPEPDTPLRGAGQFAPKTDPVLAKLEAEAARTNDRTKVVKYKREMREKAERAARK